MKVGRSATSCGSPMNMVSRIAARNSAASKSVLVPATDLPHPHLVAGEERGVAGQEPVDEPDLDGAARADGVEVVAEALEAGVPLLEDLDGEVGRPLNFEADG